MYANLLYSMNYFSNVVMEAYFSLTWPQESRNLVLNLLKSNDELHLIFNLHMASIKWYSVNHFDKM